MSESDPPTFYRPYFHDTFTFLNSSPFFLNSVDQEVLMDIDLYYQPLQSHALAILYLVLKTILIIVGECVHVQMLTFLKTESGLVNDVLNSFLCVQMIYWPVKAIFEISTDFVYPLREVIGEWFCIVAFFWIVYGMTLVVFHSFVVGLMRYSFFVHHNKILRFGKERAKMLFYYISIFIPLLVTLWAFFSRREISTISSLNKCNGIHHKPFLVEHNISSTAKRNFCFLESFDEGNNQTLATVKRTLCVLNSVLYAIMGLNVVEGIFYWRTVKEANE